VQRPDARCRHTTRFILIYTAFLPLALWKDIEWATLAVAPTITLLLVRTARIDSEYNRNIWEDKIWRTRSGILICQISPHLFEILMLYSYDIVSWVPLLDV
jgi:hypothetical protein